MSQNFIEKVHLNVDPNKINVSVYLRGILNCYSMDDRGIINCSSLDDMLDLENDNSKKRSAKKKNKIEKNTQNISLSEMLRRLSDDDLMLTRNYYYNRKGYIHFMLHEDTVLKAIDKEIEFRHRAINQKDTPTDSSRFNEER